MAEPLVDVRDLVVRFPLPRSIRDVVTLRPARHVLAVDGVSLVLRPGEVLALVGESGSGKTTTAMALVGQIRPTAGSVRVDGRDPVGARGADRLRLRRDVQIILQDPYESLNPRMTVRQIVGESLAVHGVARNAGERRDRIVGALRQAELEPAEVFLDRRPDELSGGQRQRVAIAAALVLEPRVLVADEPVSMLDVSIRAEILNLLARLARDAGLAVLMITHDLATVAAYSDRIGVMYLGRLVEVGRTGAVLAAPAHPYTQALVSVVPRIGGAGLRTRTVLRGEIPDGADIPAGCRFHPRCPVAFDACREVDPALRPASAEEEAACLLVGGEGGVALTRPAEPSTVQGQGSEG